MLGEEAKAVRAAAARADVDRPRRRSWWRDKLAAGGRLVYVGAGTSGRLGTLDAVECVPTFGVPPSRVVADHRRRPAALTRSVEGAEDNARDAEQRLRRVAVGPGRRRLLHRRLGRDAVRARRARVRALPARRARSSSPAAASDGDIALADVVIALDTGPEVIAGSTRLKAGTATKMVLNAISTDGVRAARQDLRRPDGRRAADQRQAVGARRPHRAQR